METTPKVSRVAVLAVSQTLAHHTFWEEIQIAAKASKVSLQREEITGPEVIEHSFDNLIKGGARGLIVLPHAVSFAHRVRMVSLAAKNQLPGMYSDRLYTGTTSGTDATGIHHTPDRGKVTFFEFRYGPAGFHHPADDLVPGNTGINRRHRVLPFVSDLVQIGMADAAIQDIDLQVLRPRLTPTNCERRHAGGRASRRISLGKGSFGCWRQTGFFLCTGFDHKAFLLMDW